MTRTRLPNYQNTVLLDIIGEVMPAGALQWETVAARYFEISGEAAPRDADAIKRHFNDKLCNGGKKPTGQGGSKTDLILRAQRIKLSIYQRQAIGSAGNGIGISFDGEDADLGEDDDDDDDLDEEALEDAAANGDQLFEPQFQATPAQGAAASQGSTTFAVIPNEPQIPRPQQAAGHKRSSPQELLQSKTKNMQSGAGRQAAAGQINALNNTLQDAVESGKNSMLLQFMMQMQQNMQQQQMQLQQSQQNMMMMLFMGMGRNQTSNTPFSSPMQNFASPVVQNAWPSSDASTSSSAYSSSSSASSSLTSPMAFTPQELNEL